MSAPFANHKPAGVSYVTAQGISQGTVSRETKERDACKKQQVAQYLLSLQEVSNVVVAAINSKTAVTTSKVGSVVLNVILDLGSSVSLVMEEMLQMCQGITKVHGDKWTITIGDCRWGRPTSPQPGDAPFELEGIKVMHKFVVVENLVTFAIFCVDFLQENRLVLDFSCYMHVLA